MKNILIVFSAMLLDVVSPVAGGCSCNKHNDDDYSYMSLSHSEVVLDRHEGSEAVINVSSSSRWTITADCPWLSFHPSSGRGSAEITVTAAAANETPTERKCIMTIRNKEMKQQVKVTQTGTGKTYDDK